MKPNTIELFPDGIACYEITEAMKRIKNNPAKPSEISDKYKKALEAAKREAVYFKPDGAFFLSNTLMIPFEFGKPYPIPDSYRIEIKECPDMNCEHGGIAKCASAGCQEKYAVLVPKELFVEQFSSDANRTATSDIKYFNENL